MLVLNVWKMISCSNSKVLGRVSIYLMATGLLAASLALPVQAAQPRLILQITVDALRGDLPQRFASVLGENGFRYLMHEGIHYANAHYQHANTETIVGHTSLATGTVPAAHGMVANVWFDREQDRLANNYRRPPVSSAHGRRRCRPQDRDRSDPAQGPFHLGLPTRAPPRAPAQSFTLFETA